MKPAFVFCRCCRERISRRATNCPRCGEPVSRARNFFFGRSPLAEAILLGGLVFIVWWWRCR